MVGVHEKGVNEQRFMKPNHDIPSTGKTRAKNKACQVYNSLSDVSLPSVKITLILQNFR